MTDEPPALAIIREAIARPDYSHAAFAAELNRRGMTTEDGAPWAAAEVASMVAGLI